MNTVPLPPLKAIRAHCIQCSNGQARQVPLCPMFDCPLYPFRMGRSPYTRADYEAAEEKMKKDYDQ